MVSDIWKGEYGEVVDETVNDLFAEQALSWTRRIFSTCLYEDTLQNLCSSVSTIKYTFTFICRSFKRLLKAAYSDCVVTKYLSHCFHCNFLILCFSNISYYFFFSLRRQSASGFCSFTWHCPCIMGMVNVTRLRYALQSHPYDCYSWGLKIYTFLCHTHKYALYM